MPGRNPNAIERAVNATLPEQNAESIEQTQQDLSDHEADQTNPHQVTAVQVGSIDVALLNAHTGDTGNPHAVTAAQAGAAPVAHVSDTSNPHVVTRAQIGAASAADLAAHEADTINPHAVDADQVDAWNVGSSVPANSAAAAEANTIVVANDFIYVCKAAGWGSGGENWMRVAVTAF